jgi:hypothetical protein
MTLSISDLKLDEEFRATQTGFADDNDVSTALFNGSSAKTELNALGLTFVTSPTGFPQFAEKTNFVTSSNSIVTDYYLTVAPGGVATDLFVGNNQIFLYATSNPDIVVGRVGTGTTANASGKVALIIIVDDPLNGGAVTNANLWVGLYAPIVDGGHNLVDSADQIDLSGLISLGSDFSTATEVPFSDFSDVPSGNNTFDVIFPTGVNTDLQLLVTGVSGETAKQVAVSTQGIGAGAQHVENGVAVRIDTVSGFVQDNVDSNSECIPSAIDYTAHVDIVSASFQILQTNPTNHLVDLTIGAFQVAGNAQEQGFLDDAIATDGASVQIDVADVHILDAGGVDITATFLAGGGTITVDPNNANGIKITNLADDMQVKFTTDNAPFDRLLITNVDSADTFDLGNIKVTSLVGGSDSESADLGGHIFLQDDGPKIGLKAGAVMPTITDDETVLATNNTANFASIFTTPDYGADKPGTLTYKLGVQSANVDSGLIDTATGQHILLTYNAATNTVLGKTAGSGVEVFRITVSATGVVTLDQKRAIAHSDTTSFNENSTAMTAVLITLTATATDSEGAVTGDSASATANIAASFIFKDDGPSMTPQPGGSLTPNNLQVDNNLSDAADSTDSSSYGLVPGADGKKSFTIQGPADNTGTFQWTFDNASHTSITGTVLDSNNVAHNLYTLVLNANGTYTFTMIGELPGTTLDLSTEEIQAGGPDTNTIIVGAIDSDDYVVMGGSSTVGAGNINESNGFVGVDNGNLDANETLTFTLFDGDDNQIFFESIQIGTKSAQASNYHYVAHLVGGGTAEGDLSVGKDGTLIVDPAGSVLIESVEITKLNGSATKIGVGDIHFVIPPEDVQLGFTVALTDNDNDVATQSFTVDIDGNNDGNFDATVNSLAVLPQSESLSMTTSNATVSSAALTQGPHLPAMAFDPVSKAPPDMPQWLMSFENHDGLIWTQLQHVLSDHLMEV